MTKFALLYTGGDYPEDPEEMQATMAEWESWLGSIGSSLVDGGTPLGAKDFLGGASDSGVNGFSIVEAPDMAAAKALCNGHPHIKYGGGIELAEYIQM